MGSSYVVRKKSHMLTGISRQGFSLLSLETLPCFYLVYLGLEWSKSNVENHVLIWYGNSPYNELSNCLNPFTFFVGFHCPRGIHCFQRHCPYSLNVEAVRCVGGSGGVGDGGWGGEKDVVIHPCIFYANHGKQLWFCNGGMLSGNARSSLLWFIEMAYLSCIYSTYPGEERVSKKCRILYILFLITFSVV